MQRNVFKAVPPKHTGHEAHIPKDGVFSESCLIYSESSRPCTGSARRRAHLSMVPSETATIRMPAKFNSANEQYHRSWIDKVHIMRVIAFFLFLAILGAQDTVYSPQNE